MMRLISSRGASAMIDQANDTSSNSWSIDFIHGLAFSLDYEEIAYNQTSKVISFRTETHERINIYYMTRIVGTALNHTSQGVTQLF